MELALKKAKLNPEDIDYINAHGTSTPVGDAIELNTVQKFFKNCLNNKCELRRQDLQAKRKKRFLLYFL